MEEESNEKQKNMWIYKEEKGKNIIFLSDEDIEYTVTKLKFGF